MQANRSVQSAIPAFLRDARVLQVIGQIIFVIVVVTIASQIFTSIMTTLRDQNLLPSFSFLSNRAGFDISDRPEWYSSNSTYFDAFRVGLQNTLIVVAAGLVGATFLGIFMGISLLSTNWLVSKIARVYVEIIRNTPLLVQLYVWYFVVMLNLPAFQESLTFPNEGVALISIRLFIYLILIFVVSRYVNRYMAGSPRRNGIITGVSAAVVVMEIGYWLANNRADWANVPGKGDLGDGSFLLYALVSVVLIAASWFAFSQWRWLTIGATVGQFIGGLIFYFVGGPLNSAIRTELQPWVYINIRSFAFPELRATGRTTEWLAFVALGIILAAIIWIYAGRINETTGRTIPRWRYAVIAIVALVILGWLFVGVEPAAITVPIAQDDGTITYIPLEEAREDELLTPEETAFYSDAPILFRLPEQSRFRFEVGTELRPEYMALLLGLIVYTSAFIAEIVRAGIQAVPRGQIEAARAVGLSQGQTLRLVILPQALRVIIPPLGNQYLNLAKNSSLAVAIAYADLYLITTTIMNQSGQSVTGMIMLMFSYLVISLSIATAMSRVNRRFQLVTR